jgi:phosphatidylglycerol lysyltransferase
LRRTGSARRCRRWAPRCPSRACRGRRPGRRRGVLAASARRSGAAFRAVLPAFALALAAGLLSGTPGGVGPFEITLLTLLPEAPQTGLLAAILGFRLVYFALPAILGAAWLALRPISVPEVGAPPPLSARRLRAAPGRGRARAAGGTRAARAGRGDAHRHHDAGRRRRGDPLAPVAPGLALDMLSAEALRRARRPLLYKCGARLAAEARGRGWTVLAVAEEAWLDPCAFRLDRPEMRGLRRKLRAAEAAGVTVARATALPLTEMAAVAAEWAAARGGERGFSMGRFSPDHVAAQRVWLARAEGRLLGFVTFHQGAREWTLDLVRLRPDAPDGTAHALVAAALAEAARAGLKRLSLAAVPVERPLPRPLERPAAARSGDGLRRFKSAFDPSWETALCRRPGAARARARPLGRVLARAPALAAADPAHAAGSRRS